MGFKMVRSNMAFRFGDTYTRRHTLDAMYLP